MKISKMTQAEFDTWSARSRSSYAADKMKANALTQEEANKVASADFARLLPDGLSSKNNFLFTAKTDSDEIIGFVWFSGRGEGEQKRAFICDIIVEEKYRGQGYGKKLMLHAEKEAAKEGMKRIGLHVFGFNKVAIQLYQSLGYETTDLVLEKNL